MSLLSRISRVLDARYLRRCLQFSFSVYYLIRWSSSSSLSLSIVVKAGVSADIGALLGSSWAAQTLNPMNQLVVVVVVEPSGRLRFIFTGTSERSMEARQDASKINGLLAASENKALLREASRKNPGWRPLSAQRKSTERGQFGGPLLDRAPRRVWHSRSPGPLPAHAV